MCRSSFHQLIRKSCSANLFKIFLDSFDEWYTERRIVTDQIDQVHIGSAQVVSSTNNLICANHSEVRSNLPNKARNNSIFDHLDLGKLFVEIDGVRFRRDSFLINHGLIDFIDQISIVNYFVKNTSEKNS